MFACVSVMHLGTPVLPDVRLKNAVSSGWPDQTSVAGGADIRDAISAHRTFSTPSRADSSLNGLNQFGVGNEERPVEQASTRDRAVPVRGSLR